MKVPAKGIASAKRFQVDPLSLPLSHAGYDRNACSVWGGTMIRKIASFAAAVGAAACVAGTANAAIMLNSMRVVGRDPEALSKFYAAAFGLKETNRIRTRAGGTMEREPEGRPNSTVMIGIAVDPAGNRTELIQPGSRQ